MKKQSKNLISGEIVQKEDLKIIGKSIGLRIVKLRKENKISQKELSIKTNFSRSNISKIENGKKMISIEEAKNIAKYLKTTPQFIIGGK